MGKTSNKFIATLAITNVLAFVVIFALLWMLWNNNAAQKKNVIVTYSPADLQAIQPGAGPRSKPVSTPAKPSVTAQDLSIITAVAKEVKQNIKNDGRIEQETAQDNSGVNKDKTNSFLSDREYVASYNKLASRQQPEKRDYSKAEVSNLSGANSSGNTAASTTDHFNKVDVSSTHHRQSKHLSLAQQVAAVAASNRKSDNTTAWKDYLNSLKEAEAERQNEMRTITVKRGETLWKISTRAYGTGFMYRKIFEANPHLTTPDSITVGETLRVPL